jgi:hypothetical protein
MVVPQPDLCASPGGPDHPATVAAATRQRRSSLPLKRWTTRKGTERGGRPFDKTTLYHLLTNRTYLGLVTHKGDPVKEWQVRPIAAEVGWVRQRRKWRDLPGITATA